MTRRDRGEDEAGNEEYSTENDRRAHQGASCATSGHETAATAAAANTESAALRFLHENNADQNKAGEDVNDENYGHGSSLNISIAPDRLFRRQGQALKLTLR